MGRWDTALRVGAMLTIVTAYGVYVTAGRDPYLLYVVIASLGTLAAPEFVDRLPVGPSK